MRLRHSARLSGTYSWDSVGNNHFYDEGASIRYTTDGSTPDRDSGTVYSTAVSVPQELDAERDSV